MLAPPIQQSGWGCMAILEHRPPWKWALWSGRPRRHSSSSDVLERDQNLSLLSRFRDPRTTEGLHAIRWDRVLVVDNSDVAKLCSWMLVRRKVTARLGAKPTC